MANAFAQLHKLLDDAQIPYHGIQDVTYEIDFKPEATEQHREQAALIVAGFEPEPEPQWDAFLAAFNLPGNTLYASVVGKVAAAGFLAQDHWANFKLLLATEAQRSPTTLTASINYLAQLLDTAQQPLTQQDIDGWNDLMDAYDFPDGCKLDDPIPS